MDAEQNADLITLYQLAVTLYSYYLCIGCAPEPFLPQVWKLHDYTRMEAELCRLEKGTQSHPSTIPTRVEIVMNSFGVVNLVKENPTRHHPLGNLIEECKSMHKRSNSSINHAL